MFSSARFNPRTHRKVMAYILCNAHNDFGALIITSAPIARLIRL